MTSLEFTRLLAVSCACWVSTESKKFRLMLNRTLYCDNGSRSPLSPQQNRSNLLTVIHPQSRLLIHSRLMMSSWAMFLSLSACFERRVVWALWVSAWLSIRSQTINSHLECQPTIMCFRGIPWHMRSFDEIVDLSLIHPRVYLAVRHWKKLCTALWWSINSYQKCLQHKGLTAL